MALLFVYFSGTDSVIKIKYYHTIRRIHHDRALQIGDTRLASSSHLHILVLNRCQAIINRQSMGTSLLTSCWNFTQNVSETMISCLIFSTTRPRCLHWLRWVSYLSYQWIRFSCYQYIWNYSYCPYQYFTPVPVKLDLNIRSYLTHCIYHVRNVNVCLSLINYVCKQCKICLLSKTTICKSLLDCKISTIGSYSLYKSVNIAQYLWMNVYLQYI